MKLKSFNNKWVKRIGVIVVLSGLVVVGYNFTKQDEGAAVAATVQEYTLTKQSISDTLSTSGTVQAETTEQLLGDVSSEVTMINVGIGDQVSAGQILAEMNPIDVNSSILNQEVVISNLKQDMKALGADKGTSKKIAYENAKITLANAKSNYESNQILFESGAVSQSELDQSLEAYNNANNSYENAKVTFNSYDYATEYSILEKRLEVETTKLESLQQDLLDHQVMASITGVVTALNIEEGEIPKESDVMIEIQDLANLKIEASISEYEINAVEVGQEVTITTLGNEDQSYKGMVELIYPSGVIEGSDVYVTVLIDVLNEDEMLKPNFSANLDILTASKDAAFLVPYDALVKTPKGYAVKVKGEDAETSEFVRVETGVEGDMSIEIIAEALEEGMVLLVESEVEIAEQMQNGMRIPGMSGGGGPGGNARK